jgi:hypothetical protein
LFTIEEKREQFNAFYQIQHTIKANVLPLNAEQCEYDIDSFEKNMPYAFKIAGEMSEVQAQALKPLRGLGEKLNDLVSFLQFQAQKIDLMMSYILQQQDQEEYRCNALKFGGGGIIVQHDKAVELGARRAVKLFLESEASATYCFAEAIDCHEHEGAFQVSYIFTHIREQDQELLVRASLHLQTASLRAKKNQHTT